MENNTELASFAGGCFWGVEAALSQLEGVRATRVGFMGGTTESPSYTKVCTGTTGHAEVVQCVFDPEIIPYEQLLEHFFTAHDPHSPPEEEGSEDYQYRSEIFVHSPEQQATAERVIQRLNNRPGHKKILTRISPAGPFYIAEESHQQYFAKMGERYSRPW
jgi:peptide-methionine (S)-S-oxide reductase